MIAKFGEIFSQEQAVDFLQTAIAEDHLPHAMIFAGPSGVGKRTAADALGAVLLCLYSVSTLTPSPDTPGEGRGEGIDGIGTRDKAARDKGRCPHPSPLPEYRARGQIKPCGKCESCRLMAAGNHPDFHVVYRQLIRLEKVESKARELSADVIRDYLIAPANLRPGMGHGKIFVIEEAELMNAAAQNTLLKTLEEPPKDTFIILLTDQPGALLPTIRSRCQIVPFGPIDEKTLRAELVKRGMGEEEADRAAFFAEGSLGNAIKWSEEGIIAQAEILRGQLEKLARGKASDDLAEWIRKAAEGYAVARLKSDSLSSKDQATHDGLAIYLRIASLVLRHMFLNESDADRIERICQCIEAISEAELNLQANVNVALALMNWAMVMERELVEG